MRVFSGNSGDSTVCPNIVGGIKEWAVGFLALHRASVHHTDDDRGKNLLCVIVSSSLL